MIVSYDYYNDEFMGLSVPEADFPRLEKWAERVIGNITYNRVNENNISLLPTSTQEAYKNAICSQIGYFSLYGLDTAITGRTSGGFSVGKVRIDGTSTSTGGSSVVCVEAYSYLEQTNLLNPSVGVVGDDYFPMWL